ncbi:phosphonate ABC transporter, permease protein PhnE [Longirhabdus pacifica]|uniref:phosphonate ABC transporter, permease protein PhnE n=1 Tax=Longirhabdus pacifica TaxID=2305227 RepID=UPI0010091A7D|nr:phosphonate ABC transporter, permease protein PhnE [Longirhabdus pacifica]
MSQTKLKTDLQHLKKPSRSKTYFTLLLFVVLMIVSAISVDFSFQKLFEGFPNMFNLVDKMSPPNWSYFSYITEPMLETIRMAVVGATFGSILSIPFAILSARNVTKSKWVLLPTRFLMNINRAFPDLLMAALLVAVFGLGTTAGIIALSLFSLGIVSKLTYESIEAIDPGPLEAMTAVGANKLEIIYYGVVPQIMPQYLSYCIYVFEINIRFAAILGLVGAGGIGQFYDTNLSLFNYPNVSAMIIYTLAVVLVIDFISGRLRRSLI